MFQFLETAYSKMTLPTYTKQQFGTNLPTKNEINKLSRRFLSNIDYHHAWYPKHGRQLVRKKNHLNQQNVVDIELSYYSAV